MLDVLGAGKHVKHPVEERPPAEVACGERVVGPHASPAAVLVVIAAELDDARPIAPVASKALDRSEPIRRLVDDGERAVVAVRCVVTAWLRVEHKTSNMTRRAHRVAEIPDRTSNGGLAEQASDAEHHDHNRGGNPREVDRYASRRRTTLCHTPPAPTCPSRRAAASLEWCDAASMVSASVATKVREVARHTAPHHPTPTGAVVVPEVLA